MNNFILVTILSIALISCRQKSDNSTVQKKVNQETVSSEIFDIEKERRAGSLSISSDQPDRQKIELTQPAIIIVQLDSIEIEQLKKVHGETDFFKATDDLLWYNAKLQHKMDSLGIPVLTIGKDTIDLKTPNSVFQLIKDSTFSVYTYFYFDGKTLLRKELLELLDE